MAVASGGAGGAAAPPDEPDHHQIEACGLRMGRPSFIFQSIFPKFRLAPSALAPLPPQANNASYGPDDQIRISTTIRICPLYFLIRK